MQLPVQSKLKVQPVHSGRRALLLGGLGALCVSAAGRAQSVAQPGGETGHFVVVHSMRYAGAKDSPDLSALGVLRNPIVYESALWPPGVAHDEPASAQDLQQLAADWLPGPLPTVLDIEHWSLYVNDPLLRVANSRKLLALVDGLRLARPDLKFGYYGVLPERRYWELVDPRRVAARLQWEEGNRSATQALAAHVDAVFPSLYTFYDRPRDWVSYASIMLKAARATGKPVYAYIWPRYHEGGDKVPGGYLSADYWRLELETVRRYADGAVIWNSVNEPWDPQAPWWLATVEFLKTLA